jgi:chromate transporter
MNKYLEIALIFARLGTLAFGGPAAHIAMMEKEFVEKRQWLDRDEFLNLIGFTNLIPGPNSTEMALHIGYVRGGALGMFVAGLCFIVPAMTMVLGLSYFLVEYGALPSVSSLMNGIIPVMLAIVVSVLYSLGSKLLNNQLSIILTIFAFSIAFSGTSEIIVLLGIGALYYVLKKSPSFKALSVEPFTLGLLFWTFLKIGSVLYGSGYVLLSFVKTEFLDTYQVLTLNQIMDAIAIGQVTPGPVFTTATAIGYMLFGVTGGLVATVGIFLPSFILVIVLHPFFKKLSQNKQISIFLDGVKLASLALMANVALSIGTNYIAQPLFILFPLALFLLIKTKLNPTWLILTGAIIGFVFPFLNLL